MIKKDIPTNQITTLQGFVLRCDVCDSCKFFVWTLPNAEATYMCIRCASITYQDDIVVKKKKLRGVD